MDRGMVSEENLLYMREKKMKYLVGTPKYMLKKFERELLPNRPKIVEKLGLPPLSPLSHEELKW